jgi:putative flippase GtrA
VIRMRAEATVECQADELVIPPLKRWLVFNLIGGMGILLQLAVLSGLTHLMEWHYLAATAAAVEAAIMHNFVWHERWTWAERAAGGRVAMLHRLIRFHLANGAVSLAGNVLLMRFFVGELALNTSTANLAAIAICSILNFFAGDRLVYASRRSEGKMSSGRSGPKWLTLGLLAVICGARTEALSAAELRPGTLAAWAAYVRATEDRIEREIEQGKRFLVLDYQAPRAAATEREATLSGGIPVEKMESSDARGAKIRVPDGMIHHWRGSVFLPGVDLNRVLARVENPVSEEIRQEDVLQSSVIDRGNGCLKLYLKLQRSKIVTVVYNTIHEVRYQRQLENRAWSSSKTLKIAELSHPNSALEQEKPEGRDHGFLWRLNSYWRYEQVNGGVIVECESISLSRSIPSLLEFLVRPIIDSVARESMERTLASLRDRILRNVGPNS